MRILGIESSCDETAAAVVEDGSRILASIVSSQIATHARYGGVVPELASREHLRAIVPVVRLALEQSSTRLEDLAAIAVTQGPGLVGSLLVGITYAKALALAHKLPLIAVNHIEGHIHAVVSQNAVELPALALVVSGGHTHLYELRQDEVRDGFVYRLLGKTRDDAAGEAFDKVAKLLGFGYPGGPVVDALAPHGDPGAVRFTLAKMKGNALDFSFSGLKTAVLRWVEARDLSAEISARRALLARNPQPSVEEWLEVTPGATRGLLASFQRTVIEELLRRAVASAEQTGARSLIISGGVACNSGLRIAANKSHLPYPVFFPEPGLSTDNAAMIAAAAFPKFTRGEFAEATCAPTQIWRWRKWADGRTPPAPPVLLPSKHMVPQQPQQPPPKLPIPGVRYLVAVGSGKGGVGKTTVAVDPAISLANLGRKVGLLDADVYGPNVPLMMGTQGQPRSSGEHIQPLENFGVRLMSIGFLNPGDKPLVWRGPMLHSVIQQFLRNVEWGELDYLIIDLPPGTGDVALSLIQTAPLSGAVVVTTPSDVSLEDARKAINMFHQVRVPVLGLVENMSYLIAPGSGERIDVFGHGGGRRTAEKMNVPFLGELALDPEVRIGGDSGRPVSTRGADDSRAVPFRELAQKIEEACREFQTTGPRITVED